MKRSDQLCHYQIIGPLECFIRFGRPRRVTARKIPYIITAAGVSSQYYHLAEIHDLRGLPGSRFMTFRWFATRGVEQGKQLGEAEGKLYYRAPINVTIVI